MKLIIIFIIVFILFLSLCKYIYYKKSLKLDNYSKKISLKKKNNITINFDEIYNNFIKKKPNFSTQFYNTVSNYDNEFWSPTIKGIIGLFNKQYSSGAYNSLIFKKHFFAKDYEYEITLNPINNNDIVLDCGPGCGEFCYYITNKYPTITYYGITNSEKQYNYLKNKYKKKSIHFIYGSFDNLNLYFNENTFDKIYFLQTHGYSLNRKKLFQNIYKILKKNGKCLVKSPQIYCITPSEKKFAFDAINSWGYNFSDVHTQLIELDNCNFQSLKYKEIPYLYGCLYEPLCIGGLVCIPLYPIGVHHIIFEYFKTYKERLLYVSKLIKYLFNKCLSEYFIVCTK
jgi:ubiquinone/menaquinone biosynthesis C-methylase UbiE